MADEQVWFIPVTGGGPYLPHAAASGPIQFAEQFNVQWDTNIYPTDQATAPAHPFFEVWAVTGFDNATGPSGSPTPGMLRNCHAQFRWDSCSDGEDITMGGQLMVGTVFSRLLLRGSDPTMPAPVPWDTVEVWAKYRVSEKAKLRDIQLILNDASTVGAAGVIATDPGGFYNVTNDEEWRLIWLRTAKTQEEWEDWDAYNIRATLSFLGTDNPANVGRVRVDVEWFAFRLSNTL